MLTIIELANMRKMLGISGEVIAEEMCTTRQTVSNIERGKAENKMSITFYRMTVIKLIKEIDQEKRESLKHDFENIIKCFEKA